MSTNKPWIEPTEKLCISDNKFKYNKKDFVIKKIEAIKTCDNYCSYCGGYYKKYMYCNIINSKKIIPACKLCYIITNFTILHQKELILCWSKLDQNIIVKKTMEHLKQNNKIPSVIEIDPDAKQTNISLIEFISYYKIVKTLKNKMEYKVFVTSLFDYSYLDVSSVDLFIDDDESSISASEIEADSEDYNEFFKSDNSDKLLPIHNFNFNFNNKKENNDYANIIFNAILSHYNDQQYSNAISDVYYSIMFK